MSLEGQKSTPFSWENILTSLDDAVLVIDADGKVSFLNQAAEALIENSASMTLHRPHGDVFQSNPWLVDMVEKSQAPGHNSTRAEGDFVTQRGHQLPVSLSVTPFQDPYGRDLGTILLARDLSHQKAMEEQIKRSDRLALLGNLAAGLSHEIKNPLGGIKGAAQLLRKTAQDPASRECTEIIIREADRINQLMEHLLDLTRAPKLHLEPLNIHELLDHVLALQRQTVVEGSIQVRKNFDPSLPSVRGDRAQLTQVFLNLVKNSLEAMAGTGCLTLTTRMETEYSIREAGSLGGKFIRVEIEDTGPGIQEEHWHHIFSPFFTTKSQGTGLGLAICHRIIREHGGLIRVDRGEGRGARFRVSLSAMEP